MTWNQEKPRTIRQNPRRPRSETVFSRHETEVNRNDKKPYTRKGYTVKRKIFCVRGKAEPAESGLAGRLRFRTVVFWVELCLVKRLNGWIKQARDSAPATLVWRRAAPPLVYDKRISKCQINFFVWIDNILTLYILTLWQAHVTTSNAIVALNKQERPFLLLILLFAYFVYNASYQILFEVVNKVNHSLQVKRKLFESSIY